MMMMIGLIRRIFGILELKFLAAQLIFLDAEGA